MVLNRRVLMVGETEALRLAVTQGVFAVLFVILFFYVLRENSKRETVAGDREDRLMTFMNTCLDGHRCQNEILDRVEGKVDRVMDGVGDLKRRAG